MWGDVWERRSQAAEIAKKPGVPQNEWKCGAHMVKLAKGVLV